MAESFTRRAGSSLKIYLKGVAKHVAPKKKISAKAVMVDLKEGMSDSDLMGKYGLSFQSLQDLFTKLIEAKLATKGYFQKRAMRQATGRSREQKTKTCSFCGYSSQGSFKKCPRCGEDSTEWLDTAELTDILSSSFE